MIFSFFRSKLDNNLSSSTLFNEKTFYRAFLKDLRASKKEVVIESPFITSSRIELLMPTFKKLIENRVKIHLITRDPAEHEEKARYEATNEILRCKEIGINIVLLNGKHHRKLAFIDDQILWEGSLNILSHYKSMEIMRRIPDKKQVLSMRSFLNLNKFL